jgi:cytochrome c
MKLPLFALALAGAAGSCLAAGNDDAMLALARDRGCLACHAIDGSPAASLSTLPMGPAWRDLARRYKSVKGAQQELTARVMTGSSGTTGRSSAYANHWSGQVSGDHMPSHRSAVTELEAASLVAWILALDIGR